MQEKFSRPTGFLKKWLVVLILSTLGFPASAYARNSSETGIDSLTNKGKNVQDWQGLIEEILESCEEEKNTELWQDILSDLAENPVSLNSATKESLESIPFLTESQIEALLYYIYKYGPMVSLSELLLVEGMDEQTLHWLKPFVILGESDKSSITAPSLKKMLTYGKQEVRISTGRSLQERLGYKKGLEKTLSDSAYLGDPYKILLKYGFDYKCKLQWDFILEKDEGEKLWDKHNHGIDYISFNFLIKSQKKLKELLLGDYDIRIGQGLVCSSYFSLCKNALESPVEQNGTVLNRHFSSSEFGYFRGIAATYVLKPLTLKTAERDEKYGIEVTTFGSCRKLDGEIVDGHFSTISSAELHQTQKEIEINDKINLFTLGTHLALLSEKMQFGITGIAYSFNAIFSPIWRPYNCNYFRGDRNENLSFDYRVLYRKINIFGEMAIDKDINTAILGGLVFKPYPGMSISFLGRIYAPAYNAFYANAFSEGTAVKGEKGVFFAGEWHFYRKWQLNFYYDVYSFPWLKYGINRPSDGYEYAIQTTFKPTSVSQFIFRFITKSKDRNSNIVQNKFLLIENQLKNQIRFQISAAQDYWELRTIMDGNCISNPLAREETYGFALSQEANFSPVKWPFSLSLKYTMFDTDDFNNRIFSYEKSLPGVFSMPSFYGSGNRLSLLIKYKFSSNLSFWVKVGHVVYRDRDFVGTGIGQVQGNCLTDISGMIRLKF